MSHNHTRLILQSQCELRASHPARRDITTLPPVRDALPSCSTPRDHAGDNPLSGQSGYVSRGMSHNHTRLILQSQFEVVRLVSLDVIARPSRRAGRATELRHTPRSCGQYSPVGTEWGCKPRDQSQPYPADTSIAIRSGASRLAQCDSTTFPPCGTRYRAAPHPGVKRIALSGKSGDVSRGTSRNRI